jgi:hypothetical protein
MIKMTMAEYKKAIAENIPLPSTIQQEMLMNAVMSVNDQLKQGGEAHLSAGRYDGNRTTLCAMARNVKKMYQDKGYTVHLCEYSQNNRNNYFSMTIEIGA